MKVKPLHDRILVQRVEEEKTTKGGIIIPDTAKEKPAEGKVIAVGDGKIGEDGKRIPLEVKAGGSHPVRQILGYGDQDLGRRVPHPA